MTRSGERPNSDELLQGLKDFQRKTVNYVFNRLYGANPAKRFLVADEVGLGKTMVAKGVIAKALDHLWDTVERIDIIYICSNADIARQNINRIVVGKENHSLASRITLLPIQIHNLKDKKLNFVSFTPGTSFNMGDSGGVIKERLILYHMLKDEWNLAHRMGPINLLQVSAGKERWRQEIKVFDPDTIDTDLQKQFLNAVRLKDVEARKLGENTLQERFEELCQRYRNFRKHIPYEDRWERNKIIGELRAILASSCVQALEPDLVILDEFQRFKDLLDGNDPASELAKDLFNHEDAKVLLLSATPYKMYTLPGEVDDNHHEDFIRTVNFLLDNEKETEDFRKELALFRKSLFSTSEKDAVVKAKSKVEKKLRNIMVRTERVRATRERDGMIREIPASDCVLKTDEIKAFALIDRITRELEAGDALEYWKSAPYLLNFMDSYQIKNRFKELVKNSTEAFRKLGEFIPVEGEGLLSWEEIHRYEKIDPANAKLRSLINKSIDSGGWKLLWVPPSMPYYRVQGAVDREGLNFTKSLVFSAWQVVPKVISALCSYEAERLMTKAYGKQAMYETDANRKGKQSALLVFRKENDRFRGMPVFTLMYPCLTLAKLVDPLKIARRIHSKGRIPDLIEIKNQVENDIKVFLGKTVNWAKHKGVTDERWYWAALALLDRRFYREEAASLLKNGAEEPWRSMIQGRGEDGAKDENGNTGAVSFAEHVDEFSSFFENPGEFKLGAPPDDLIEVLALVALGSPAVTALRGLLRLYPEEEACSNVLHAAAKIAVGFRTMYNLPTAINLLRGIYKQNKKKPPYWQEVLLYGSEGNLQAVLDEYFHILRESLGLFGKEASEAAGEIANTVCEAVSLRTSRLDMEEIVVNRQEETIELVPRRLRCRYALRLGEAKSDDGDEVTREDQVRTAFNSPFRPFILATTSVGQEGLDFHLYCHSIWHWNLPSNPVDLEQREGRIHRYKGHVIRKNIARKYGVAELTEKKRGLQQDPWLELFKRAVKDRNPGVTDLVPYWIFEADVDDAKEYDKIERYIPILPLSRDKERYKNLIKTLAYYRLAFGQPRQDDLVDFLEHAVGKDVQLDELYNYKIDLSPR